MDVPLTIVMFACGYITLTTGSTSLHLTSSPATASPSQPYTMMCSSSGSGSRARAWYWGNDIIFRANYVSDTQCRVDIANNDIYYNQLSGRVNVNCSYNQYTMTLRINTSIDNGSVWWCVDEQGSQGRQESKRLTIHVQPLVTMSSTTTTAAKSVTSTSESTEIMSPHEGGAGNVVYIAVGVVGGVAVIIVVVVVGVLCIGRKRRRHVNKASTCDHQYGKSHTYYNENHGLQEHDIDDKVVMENDIYETSNDVTPPKLSSTNDQVMTDLYAQVQKPKKSEPGPTAKTVDTNVDDLYAKPDKRKKHEYLCWKSQLCRVLETNGQS